MRKVVLYNRRDFFSSPGIANGMNGAFKNPEPVLYQEKNKTVNNVIVENAFATLNDGMVIFIPFWRIETGKPGPSLMLLASQHGNEIQGAEVARRFMEVCARQLRTGSVWLLPMANLNAVQKRRHSINLGPGDPVTKARVEDHNMNLIWPGKAEGNDTERITYSLNHTLLRYCTHLVDIHCYNHFNAAETIAVNDNEPSFPMGEVTTTRFITYNPTPNLQTASQMIRRNGGGAIELELSGQYQMQEKQVQTGLDSVINIARVLGMLKGKPELIGDRRAVRNSDTSHEIKAPCSGLFVPAAGKDKKSSLMPEDYVEKGQLLGHIINEQNLDEVPVIAPYSGYIWQLGACHTARCDTSLPAQHPYSEEGERIAIIVSI